MFLHSYNFLLFTWSVDDCLLDILRNILITDIVEGFVSGSLDTFVTVDVFEWLTGGCVTGRLFYRVPVGEVPLAAARGAAVTPGLWTLPSVAWENLQLRSDDGNV